MRETDFVRSIAEAGGRVYIAGGWVRDRLRGVEAHDRDYVVTGLTEDAFRERFPQAFKVGRGFPVYRMSIGGAMSEVAFARRDIKTGTGYRGFAAVFAPATTIEDDLGRRDTTMNSIAFSPETGAYIDPCHGVCDIRDRLIRATSPRFSDDPVRALRAARQAAQFGFRIEEGTTLLMHACRDELAAEPKERLTTELAKALDTDRPSVFFRNLMEARILDVAYPQIFALVGKTQHALRHPEGDAFEHTMEAVDRAARLTGRTEVRFAVLVHDLGKGLTATARLPYHRRHDVVGLYALRDFNRHMTLPRRWMSCAAFAIREHKRACSFVKSGKIADFIVRLSRHPIGFDGFSAVLRADGGELPAYLAHYDAYLDAVRSVSGRDAPAGLTGARVGAWVRERQIRAVEDVLRRSE